MNPTSTPPLLRAFKRSDHFWFETRSCELSDLGGLGVPFQLVPADGPAGGWLGLVSVTVDVTTTRPT